jgi:hypothetical protein
VSARTDVVLPPLMQRAKAAYRKSVAACGGQDGTAATTGKSQGRISLYGSPNSDVFPTLDAIVEQEAVSHGTPGHPHVTRFLAREAGYELFKLPSAEAMATIWGQHLAGIAKEGGEVMTRLALALADGRLTEDEKADCLPDARDLLRVAVELVTALEAKSGDDK